MDSAPRTALSTNQPQRTRPSWVSHVFEPQRRPAVVGDWAWKLVLALVSVPVAVLGALSWLLATWAGSWLAPLVAAALLVLMAILTAGVERAKGWMFLLTTSFAAAGMINWFGGPASMEYGDNAGETSHVSADPVPGVTQSPGIRDVQPASPPRTMS